MITFKFKRAVVYAGLFASIIGGVGVVQADPQVSFRAVNYTQVIKSDNTVVSDRPAQNDTDRLNTLFDDDAPGGFMDSALKSANLAQPINLDPKAMDPRLGTLRRGLASFDRSSDVFTISLTWSNQGEAQRIVDALQSQYIKVVGPHESLISLDPRELANLNQLELATIEFVQNNKFLFPTLKDQKTLVTQLTPYLTSGADNSTATADPTIFEQPGQGVPYGANASLSDEALGKVQDPAQTILFYETVPDKDGNRYVGYADGDCKVVVAGDWNAVKKASGMR